jgi:outer membrane protein TolC
VTTTKEVPISLEAIFRLAEASNPKIAQSREKLAESLLVQEMNCRCWLPDTYAGVTYYRHEGGIQNEDGTLTRSSTGALIPGLTIRSELDLRESTFRALNDERQIWQDKAELVQITQETLLEAASTYVDLLTARRGEALALELEKAERKVLERVQRLAEREVSALALVSSARSAVASRQQFIAKLRQQGNAASVKLVYLLGLMPGTVLVPMDKLVAPVELVDVAAPTEALVTQAMTTGPGVNELEGLLNVIQTGLEKSYGYHNLLPTLGLNLFEGGIGAGPGGTQNWANRFDATVSMRWNLTELTKVEWNRQRARHRQAQTLYALSDLRGKLALGVQEGKDAVLSGREQIGLGVDAITQASESYRLSDKRLEDGVPGANPAEVLLAIRNLEQAHFNHLLAIAAHNKAQMRLVLLLGPAPSTAPAMLRPEFGSTGPLGSLPMPAPVPEANLPQTP